MVFAGVYWFKNSPVYDGLYKELKKGFKVVLQYKQSSKVKLQILLGTFTVSDKKKRIYTKVDNPFFPN